MSRIRIAPNPRLVVILAVLGVGVLLIIGAVGWLSLETWRFYRWPDNHPADIAATDENAAAGAAHAGLQDTGGLRVIALRHQQEIDDETWRVTWLGTPQSAQRLVAASTFAALPQECVQADVYGSGSVRLEGCQKVSDQWRRPDGHLVSRTIVHGRMPDGRYIVSLRAIGP